MILKQFLYSAIIKYDDIPLDEYPFNLPFIATLNLKFHPNVTFIVGENGIGKSTLLEALAIKMGFNPEGGTKFINFATRESHSELYRYLRLYKNHRHPENHFFLRAESFFNVATTIDSVNAIHNYGGKSLHEQSHGESFFSLFMHRFGKDGFYILDEPEAALSPNRQMSMLVRIKQLIDQNCQFIIATHSPILLSYPDAIIYQINEKGIEKVAYEDTEIYTTTKYFLNNYKSMHNQLLNI